MSKMRSYLGDQGISQGSSSSTTTPISTTYFTGVYLPSVKKSMGPRNEQEMRCMAAAVDHIHRAEFAQASGLLVQQCKSIEQLQADGHWGSAKHLSTMNDSRVGLVDEREKEDLHKDERAELGLQGLQAQVSGGRPGAAR